MKPIVVGCIVALLCACSAQARLGETEEQIMQRYGEPISELPKLINYNGRGHWGTFFRYNGYVISVVFDTKSLCVREAYSRCDGMALIDVEMQKFLEINSGGKEWSRSPDKEWPADDAPVWVRSDSQVKAFYNNAWKVFVVSRFVPRQPQNRTSRSLQGF